MFLEKKKINNFFVNRYFNILFLVCCYSGLAFLSFLGCVSIWDDHLSKVHLMDMELLEKKKIIDMELLEKKKFIEAELLEKKKIMDIDLLEKNNYVRTLLPWVIGLVGFTLFIYMCGSFDMESVISQAGMQANEKISPKIAEIWCKFDIMYEKVDNIEGRVIDLNHHVSSLTSKKSPDVVSESDIINNS